MFFDCEFGMAGAMRLETSPCYAMSLCVLPGAPAPAQVLALNKGP